MGLRVRGFAGWQMAGWVEWFAAAMTPACGCSRAKHAGWGAAAAAGVLHCCLTWTEASSRSIDDRKEKWGHAL